jgi:hypothetical protein
MDTRINGVVIDTKDRDTWISPVAWSIARYVELTGFIASVAVLVAAWDAWAIGQRVGVVTAWGTPLYLPWHAAWVAWAEWGAIWGLLWLFLSFIAFGVEREARNFCAIVDRDNWEKSH